MMKRTPAISTSRAVEVYREMLWWRRQLFDDGAFFKVPDAWDALCECIEQLKTKLYRLEDTNDPKAAMMVLGDSATLIVDERLIERARNGQGLANTTLAHEISHLVLDHHARSAKAKQFRITDGPKFRSRVAANLEENEADLGAVFFQCGVALLDTGFSSVELARRAFADVALVRKAQRYVQLEVFRKELRYQNTRYERVIL